MPKKIHKIDQFHGGLNSASDPRDIADNELAAATDVMVDELGRIRTIGRFIAHDSNATGIATVEAGYGLFQFSHDRTGADVAPIDLYGSHTGVDSGTAMIDEIADFPIDGLIGATITNLTDGSTGIITDNTATQIDVAELTGGTDNSWDAPVEMIADSGSGSAAKNREFASASDWVEYSPGAANLDAFGDDGDPAYLEIDPTSATDKEGAELGTGYFATLIPYKTYRVSAKIWSGSGTIDNFKIELGGVASESFTISTSQVLIVKDITVNSDANLRIYYENAATTLWYIDDVSIKQIDKYRITGFPQTGEDYIALVDAVVFTEATCNYNNDPTITHDGNTNLVGRAGIPVSGNGIPPGSYIKTINSSTSFELSTATVGGIYTDSTLTFGGGVRIYGRNRDTISGLDGVSTWSPGSPIQLGGAATLPEDGIRANFYYVDGALRISDGNFGNSNQSQWYGYINRKWFPGVGSGYSIDQWHQADQAIAPPTGSYYKKNWVKSLGETDDVQYIPTSHNYGDAATFSPYTQIALSTLAAAWDASDKVSRVRVSYQMWATSYAPTVTIDFKVGIYTDDGWQAYAQHVNVKNFKICPNNSVYHHDFIFDPDTMNVTVTHGSGTQYLRIEATPAVRVHHGTAHGLIINASPVYEAQATTLPDLHPSGTAFANGYLTGNNVCMLWGWHSVSSAATEASWVPAADNGLWKIGATFIYDGNQESQLTELIDEANGSVDGMNLFDMDTLTSSGSALDTFDRPAVAIAIADPNHDGAGESDGTTWNKRVTGCNIYIKNVYAAAEGTAPNTWFLQYSCDFITGKMRIESTQNEVDALYYNDVTTQSYYYWILDTTHTKEPASLRTYEMSSGYDSTLEDAVVGYKTAVVSNRTAYIGNVDVTKADGNTEVLGDAMVKSFVNKFDTFPLSRTIEASVRDGDEIVKLEEYADRILQFKKTKMHLINVSQELEFLEETFMHKGVVHPAATCKTDFGIAWVNNLGCYLYDGEKVTNLLEKQGRQIIKESDWESFITDHSMIGYIPKKRQLMVLKNARGKFRLSGTIDPEANTTVPGVGTKFKDEIAVGDSIVVSSQTREVSAIASNTSLTVTIAFSNNSNDTSPDCIPQSSEGDIYLYDMVTQSWVRGDGVGASPAVHDLAVKSNFATDWNGDLIHAHSMGTGSIEKWSDASFEVPNADIKTKDIDFGQPAQRKKIYRVRISYKGDADQLITKFSVNGDTDTLYQFINPDSGSADDTPLADKTDTTEWHHAELKPATSSQANNVYSFQLHMSTTLDLDFEINDISIVYRLKGVK